MSATSTAELLRQFAFLAPFDTQQLEHIAQTAPRARYKTGDTIVRIGDPSGAMYLILEGEVKVFRPDTSGEEILLTILKSGQVFGELALLSQEPRMATVAALTECVFLVIDRRRLIETIAAAPPDAILKLFAVLGNQLRTVNEREFREIMSKRTLEAEMEAERQRALTQMVAGVAHELNTPLGVVITAASIVEREIRRIDTPALHQDPDARQTLEDINEALELIKNNIQRAHKLVQDFKKVSVSQLSDVKEPMLLPEAVHETVNLAKAHLKRSGLDIQVTDEIPAELSRWVGYRGYLSQILLNLLTNIERYAYTPGTGGVAEVILKLDEPDHFAIIVRDRGKGMPPDVADRIFEPFYTTGRSAGGTGLGMAIVQNLVTTALKGAIRVQSTLGVGTEVTVSFPRTIPD